MIFLVITKIPSRQGMLGPIKAQNIVEEKEAKDIEELKNKLDIPLDSTCLVVGIDHVVTVKSRVVNEVENGAN